MGFNKALLDIGGRPLISLLAERVRPVAGVVIISSNDASSYGFLNLPVVPDIFRGHGPLAGFHAAMIHYVCPLYIMLACDLLNIRAEFLQSLISFAEGFDAVIPRTRDGVTHPLCAVYRRTCLPVVERALESAANKVVLSFIDDSLAVKWLGPEEGRFADADLANLNTPEDLRRLGIAITS